MECLRLSQGFSQLSRGNFNPQKAEFEGLIGDPEVCRYEHLGTQQPLHDPQPAAAAPGATPSASGSGHCCPAL